MENKSNQRIYGMLGFAMRAGKITLGTDTICTVLGKRDFVKLVALCPDASDGSKKKIINKCAFYGVKVLELPFGMEELGRLLGKTYGPAAVAITDEGFAREIEKCGALLTNERSFSPKEK